MIKLFIAVLLAALPLAAHGQSPPTRFTVTVEGSGPDVIMIPGLTSNRRVWDQSVRALGGRYRVHRLQIAGFAGEPAGANAHGSVIENVVSELHEYIVANRLNRPKLVGHSIGGLLSLMLAERHPDDAGAALIVDALPFYGMLFGPDATVASIEPRAATLRDAIVAMDDAAWGAQQSMGVTTLVANDSARPAVLEDSLASDRRVVARALYEDMITDMRPVLPTLRTPLTIVYAVNPFATEDRFGRLFREGYAGAPNVRFVAVEPSHHFIMLDQPDRFTEILLDFLQQD